MWLKRCNRISLNHDTKDNEKRATLEKKIGTCDIQKSGNGWLAGVVKAFTPGRGRRKGEASNLLR